MNPQMKKILTRADGRYLTSDERETFRRYAESMPARLRLAEAIEQQEETTLRSIIDVLQVRYPDFAKSHEQGWARMYRDLQLVLRASVQAMLVDDVKRLDDHLLFWLRSTMTAGGLPADLIRDSFALLHDETQATTDADVFVYLDPYLSRSAQVLGEAPAAAA